MSTASWDNSSTRIMFLKVQVPIANAMQKLNENAVVPRTSTAVIDAEKFFGD